MPPKAKKDDPLLTIEEAAKRLRTTKGVLYKWRYERKGPRSFKNGARVVYFESVIEEYLAAQDKATGRGAA